MKCQMCGKKPAKVHFTEMKDDEVRQLRLCERCAEERGYTKMDENHGYALPDFLGQMADETLPGELSKGSSAGCPHCTMTYTEFKETGRLGCSECYEVFRLPLAPLLKRIHGTDRHSGKSPAGVSEVKNREAEMRVLKRRLEVSIQSEDFEEAARLRDQIRTLEQE